MKIETGPENRSWDAVPAEARKAEALGYDGFLSNETKHDPFFPLVLAAGHTQCIELGTDVAIAFPRSPMIVANIAWDLQAMSKGRFALGLGTQVKGHNERRFSVPWTSPGPRLREYVLSLRAIWDCWQNGTKLNFQGEHYTFTLMTHYFNPGPIEHPKIPIYIAGINPYNCRLAGELCDGIRLHSFCTPKYLREVILPTIEEGAKKAGRSLKDVEISGATFIATGPTEEAVAKAREGVRQQISFYASTRTYHPVLTIHGWQDTGEKLHEMSVEGKWDQMTKEITDEMLETFALVGTYDEIVGKIKTVYGGLLTRIILSIPAHTREEEERVKDILKALRE